jgi:hypothetical protein
MGIVMPETRWAVSVQQGNTFYDCLLHLVGCFIRVIEDVRNHKPLKMASNSKLFLQYVFTTLECLIVVMIWK